MGWCLNVLLATSMLFVYGEMFGCDNQHFGCWSRTFRFYVRSAIFPCSGETLCHCFFSKDTKSRTFGNKTTDCSSRNLSFVPYVSWEYLFLNLSNNNIHEITGDFFSNVSKTVHVIDLFNNDLAHLASSAFEGLPNLTHLFLGGSNSLGYPNMSTLVSLPHVTFLGMGCLKLGLMPGNIFRDTNKPKTTWLDLSWNQIPSMNLSVFQPLKHLETLTLWRNEIYNLETAYLPSFKRLDLEANRLYHFPRTCTISGKSLFPSLNELILDQNMIECIHHNVCLPNLTSLSLNYNHFKYFVTNTFSITRFPSLYRLSLMQMEDKILQLQRFFINNSLVGVLAFNFNQMDFSSTAVHQDAFGSCKKIWVIALRGNNFNSVSERKFRRLLRPMRDSLRVLYLGNAQIRQLSPKTFCELKKLNALYLYGNSLFSLPDGAFDCLPRLTNLQLDGNNIATISENTFGSRLRSRLQNLTLAGNPFQCTCDILWFQGWMKRNYIIFQDFHSRASYRCFNLNNMSLPEFILNDQACLLGSDAEALTIAFSCLLIFFLLVFIIFFRFRWHLRLWLYEVCRGPGRRRSRVRHFKYDVFVSYAEENAGWVEHELLPVMEDEWGLRLCVHHRDFVPGKHIMDNISDCMEDSDRVLMVFSPHFARSEWCQFELKLCQVCVMERDDVLVVVTLEKTRLRDMTGPMTAVMRTTTYIEWEEEQAEARGLFWQRLQQAVEESDEIMV